MNISTFVFNSRSILSLYCFLVLFRKTTTFVMWVVHLLVFLHTKFVASMENHHELTNENTILVVSIE